MKKDYQQICENYFNEEIMKLIKIVSYSSGQIVVRQDEPLEYLFLLLEGKCSIKMDTENGKTVILNTLNSPSLIGEMELIQNITTMSVTALSDCVMAALPYEKCKERLLNDVHFLRAVYYDLVSKERTEAIKMINSFAYSDKSRVASFILSNQQMGKLDVKKSVISESLGISYRHIERIMSEFVDNGYLRKEKLTYWIIDEKSLFNLTKQD